MTDEPVQIARGHSIERTSPKGEPFVGTCWQCGRTGLTIAAMTEPCENIAGLTETESLLIAVEPPETTI